MRIHSKYFFDDIRKAYNIDSLIADDDFVYCKIIRGMYGLKQAAKLARDKLVKDLAPFGYAPDIYQPNIWRHKTRPITFVLCVDDFGIKFFNHDDVTHLQHVLHCGGFKFTSDYSGKDYCGLSLKWDYKNKYVDISMPNFVNSTLKKLQAGYLITENWKILKMRVEAFF